MAKSKASKKSSSKSSSKSSNKSSSPIKELIINNASLIIPIFTYAVFKYFTNKVFVGKQIQYIKLFHMIVALTLVYSITLKNICGQTNNSVIMKPLQFALIVYLIMKLINMFNPCREYMTPMQENILFSLLLVIIFNLINYFISKQKDNYCKKEDNKFVVIFLIMVHVGLIYMKVINVGP